MVRVEKYKIQGSKTRESTKLKVVSLKRTRLTKLQPGRQKKKDANNQNQKSKWKHYY